ncbi:membrane protein insertase YidC [uncultured bacterium]|nr:membrane protein insertase YidC [uncultured bacterium]
MKKNIKHLSVLAMLGGLMPLLTGCVRTTSSGKPYGFVYDYLAVPGQKVMNLIAQYVGSYGLAIIVLTVIVRLVLMPLMISQMKKMTVQQEKISFIQPQLKAIQNKLRHARDPQDRMAANQEMMALYRNNSISMVGGIGCLPLLIQLPIFAALYAAIRYSPELAHTTFMGISLGQKSILLAVLSFLIYVLQAYISLIGIPESQKKQMKMMMLFNPVMILIVTFSSPAGLGLYFFIGGIFACIQTLIINLYRPRIRRKVVAYAKAHPVKPVKVTPNHSAQPTTTGNGSSNNDPTLAKIHELNREHNQAMKNHNK